MTTTQAELDEELAVAATRVEQAKHDLVTLARRQHAQGRSWAKIAAALNVSRQAAWERFGKGRS